MKMISEDPCLNCALRTAAALGWTLELPADHPEERRSCELLMRQAERASAGSAVTPASSGYGK